MTDLRDRLLERCGLPLDCGWTDDQLFEHIDLGLHTNSRTEPVDGTPRAKHHAQTRDLAWALNVHSLDAFVGMSDHVLAALLLDVVHALTRAKLGTQLDVLATREEAHP